MPLVRLVELALNYRTNFATDAKQIDVSWPISKFKVICQKWANYNSSLNYLGVQPIRKYANVLHVSKEPWLTLSSFDLPDDVFGPDETKPTKAKKKGARRANGDSNSVPKKRKTNDENEVSMWRRIDSGNTRL